MRCPSTERKGEQMKLAQVLQGMQAPRIGSRCSVGALLEQIDKGEAQECRQTLADHAIPTSMLTDAINTAYGSKLGKASVGRHRRGDCKCD